MMLAGSESSIVYSSNSTQHAVTYTNRGPSGARQYSLGSDVDVGDLYLSDRCADGKRSSTSLGLCCFRQVHSKWTKTAIDLPARCAPCS